MSDVQLRPKSNVELAVEQNKPRLLVIGDFGVQTGFNTVSDSMVEHLSKDFLIRAMGISFNDEDSVLHIKDYVQVVYKAAQDPADLYGLKRLPKIIYKFRPEYIWMNNDLPVVWKWTQVILKSCKDFGFQDHEIPKITGYCPIDGPCFNTDPVKGFLNVGNLVTFTNYGIEEIAKGLNRFDGLSFEEIDKAYAKKLFVAGHSVNTKHFYPIPKEAARGIWQDHNGNKKVKDSDFVIGWVNRNQPRKFLSLALEGFAQFAKNKDDVRMLVRASRKDVSGDFLQLARYLGVMEKLILSHPMAPGGAAGATVQELNYLYNACDVVLSTSLSEGWGLTESEAGACKKALILPDNTVRPELWGGKIESTEVTETTIPAAAYLMECEFPISGANLAQSRGSLPLPKTIVKALEYFYYNEEEVNKYGELAYERVNNRMTWENIAQVNKKAILY